MFDPKFLLAIPELAKDYKIPAYFQQDFFSTMTREERPHWQWLVVGPARSGSSFHQDPHLTSAWNALISGEKRWFLYPPHYLPDGVVHDGYDDYDAPDVMKWMLEHYPKCRYRPMEITQKPGEIIFVPSGWWHQVLNVTDTVAVTQNVCNASNLKLVWHDLRSCNTTLASLLYQKIKDTPYVKLLPAVDLKNPALTKDESSSSSSSSTDSSSD